MTQDFLDKFQEKFDEQESIFDTAYAKGKYFNAAWITLLVGSFVALFTGHPMVSDLLVIAEFAVLFAELYFVNRILSKSSGRMGGMLDVLDLVQEEMQSQARINQRVNQ